MLIGLFVYRIIKVSNDSDLSSVCMFVQHLHSVKITLNYDDNVGNFDKNYR
jgi:hypothetical protein